MHNYRFKYLSTIDGDKWITCIITADTLNAAIVKLKETRKVVNSQFRLVGHV